jgi:hypothetical protein
MYEIILSSCPAIEISSLKTLNINEEDVKLKKITEDRCNDRLIMIRVMNFRVS